MTDRARQELERYFRGELTPDELIAFQHRVAEDSDLRIEFDRHLATVRFSLAAEAGSFSVSQELLVGYVEGSLDANDLELVETLLETDQTIREQVAELRSNRIEIEAHDPLNASHLAVLRAERAEAEVLLAASPKPRRWSSSFMGQLAVRWKVGMLCAAGVIAVLLVLRVVEIRRMWNSGWFALRSGSAPPTGRGQLVQTTAAMRDKVLSEALNGPCFTENGGQWDPRAKFLARTGRVDMWITATGIKYQWYGPALKNEAGNAASNMDRPKPAKLTDYTVGVEFVGATGHGAAGGLGERAGISNYVSGQRHVYKTRRFVKATIRDLYPGIDLVALLDGADRRPRYDLVVHPGADPGQIRMRYQGARHLAVAANGRLAYDIPFAHVSERRLVAYQPDSPRRDLSLRETIGRDGTVAFRVGTYQKRQTLVIDPLEWSTYVGSDDRDSQSYATAVDSDGSVSVTGITNFPLFPVASGTAPRQASNQAWVARFSATGDLVYATYFGGGQAKEDTEGFAIALDARGSAYVAGYTTSANLPVTDGSKFGSGNSSAGFIAKFSTTGDVEYAKYLTGSGAGSATYVRALAVTPAGVAVVGGQTTCPNWPQIDPIQTGPNGSSFISEVSQDGSRFLLSTYYGFYAGGNRATIVTGLAYDAQDNLFVAGYTNDRHFAGTPGGHQTSVSGICDCFVTELSKSVQSVIYSTLIGGTAANSSVFTKSNSLAIDASGNAYVTGVVVAGNFPVTKGVYSDRAAGTGVPTFVACVSPGGASLRFSTVVGLPAGSNYSEAAAPTVSVDSAGRVYIGGGTAGAYFPVTRNAFRPERGPGFLYVLSPDASKLLYGTYFGATVLAVGALRTGDAVVVGAAGPDLDTTPGAFESSYPAGSQSNVAYVSILRAVAPSDARP